MTYGELLDKMEQLSDVNFAYMNLGRMMDFVEEETGVFPNWNDTAPDWIIENCLGKKG